MPVALLTKQQIKKIGPCIVKERVLSVPSCKNLIKLCNAEITSPLNWKQWTPGTEYTKYIIIKNISSKMQKYNFELPKTPYFLTTYPKKFSLGIGTKYYLPIIFRPLEHKEYTDRVKFTSTDGTFTVELAGLLPSQEIKLQKSVVMPICSVFSQTTATVKLKNTGALAVQVKWLPCDQFEICCPEGSLSPGQVVNVTIVFKPKTARTFVAEIVCKYGTELQKWKILQVTAQGKYPFLMISSPYLGVSYEESPEGSIATVDFGIVSVGKTMKTVIHIQNRSQANVRFRIEHLKSAKSIAANNVFVFPEKGGTVAPKSNFEIPIHFTPDLINSLITEYFCVIPHGHISRNLFKCIGYSQGPKVYFKYCHLNFQIVKLGYKASRKCTIVNDSSVPIQYEILIDNEYSVFSMDYKYGQIPAKSSQQICIDFRPQAPINYYRKLTCLIHDQDPIFLHVLGTCNKHFERPYFLAYKHIKSYQYKVRQGFGSYPPDQLNELIDRHVAVIDSSGKIIKPKNVMAAPMSPMEVFFKSSLTTDECSESAVEHFVSLDITDINFGRHLALKRSIVKEIAITNNTRGKVVTQWTTGVSNVFSVIPASIEIPSKKSASVKVFFTPIVPHRFFENILECFVYFKCLQTYQIARPQTMCPPFRLTLCCSGYTYPVNHQMFVPQPSLKTFTTIRFPSINQRCSGYRTMVLYNSDESPILYQFENDPTGIISVKPSRGLIQNGHKIFIVKFTPREVKKYTQEVKMYFNLTTKFSQTITVHGCCESAAIQLPHGNRFYFKPTCVGCTSEALYLFRNSTNKILNYSWYQEFPESKSIEVDSKHGTLLPNAIKITKFTFTPSILGKKTFVFNLQVSPGDCEKSTANVKVYEIKGSGLGAVGELTVDQSYTNFGGVVVGRPTQRDLVVCNRQDCEICCRLFLKQSLNGIDLPFEKCTAIQLSDDEIIMPAKSKQILSVVVVAPAQGSYQFSILYKVVVNEAFVKDPNITGYKHLCHLLMTGVYPLVKISDIQGRQTAKRIKKRQLWSSFSIDCFNSYMNSDPTYRELNESAERQQTTENFPKFETQSIIDFDFGAAPLGSPMSEFVLQFHNTGPITAQWDFLYPEDLKMDLEPWANTDDDYSPQTVLDEKHFTVTPKQCQIEPGETIDVTFCFEHTCLGNFQFPVLFKMKSGREILVNFLGVTVEVDKPYIHFNSLEHMFSPVPIGVEYQPTQLYELYNAGAIAVEYVVDMDPLVDIKAVNYNYPIFNCRNPIGMVEPGHTAILEWVFSPLESKTYSVDVPIYIQEEDPIIVRFSGAGYEISRMGDTNPYSEVCNTLISDRQMIRLPDQFVSLSHDKLSFGRIPLFATKRHILIANNFSSDRNANIMWYLDKKEHEELITVIPKNYLLRPNESVIFQVNFLDRGSPAFYEMQMFCEITDETEVHGYKIELKQWLCEQERQRNEFKITEKNMEVVTPDYDKDELYVSSKRLRALLKPLKDFPTDVMAKYETLPPIGQQKESSKAQGKKHFSNSKILLWKKPVMPVCMELAVSITAQTISPEEFETFHQSEFQKYLINKTHYISSDPKEESTLSEGSSVELNRGFTTLDLTRPQVLSCLKSEKEMVTYILNYIVRGILHNTYFQMCLRDVKNEKPGYFQQFVAPIHPRHNRFDKVDDYTSGNRPSSQLRVFTKNFSESLFSMGDANMSFQSANYSFMDDCNVLKQDEDERERLDVIQHVEFNNFAEEFLQGCLVGIIDEAMRCNFNITAPSRFVALPRKLGRHNTIAENLPEWSAAEKPLIIELDSLSCESNNSRNDNKANYVMKP